MAELPDNAARRDLRGRCQVTGTSTRQVVLGSTLQPLDKGVQDHALPPTSEAQRQPLCLTSRERQNFATGPSVLAWCEACGQHAVLNADHLPADLPVPDVALRLKCSRCGSKDIETRPEWRELRRSGQAVRGT